MLYISYIEHTMGATNEAAHYGLVTPDDQLIAHTWLRGKTSWSHKWAAIRGGEEADFFINFLRLILD